jgi:hypothetical protein
VNKKLKAIQFVGTQRSGSNLLRLMLNQLSEISAPHPPHILKTFFPLLKQYGDLSIKENFRLLAEDVCEWVNVNPVPWEGVHFYADEIIRKCSSPTLIELFAAIYEQKAIHDRASFWCCKSMESVHYVDEIEVAGLKPYYIYIYRDGRDVALSFMKAIVGPKHIYYLAKKWAEEQKLSLRARERVGRERFIEVRYEDLIHTPRLVMKSICDGLGVPFSDEIFEYFHSEESINTANAGQMWKNVVKPIMPDNHDKFRKEFTEDQLRIFEQVAGDVLDQLGYKGMFWPETPVGPFSKEQLNKFKKEGEIQLHRVIEKATPEELQRRKPQEELLKKIESRTSIV